jgi:hypothetical protein
MNRWAANLGWSLASVTGVALLVLFALALMVVGILYAGVAILTGVAVYFVWSSWKGRANHAWR